MADRDPGMLTPAGIDPLLRRSKLPLNDMGNAERFCALAKGRLKFVGEIGRQGGWVWFDGVRWTAHDGDARARALALAVCAELQDESRALATATIEDVQAIYGPRFEKGMAEDRVKEIYAWSMKTGNSDRTAGLIRQAQGLTDSDGAFLMRADLDAFDTDPYAYHCLNGTVRFVETGDGWVARFTEGHDPADMFMQVANVAYDPLATCGAWRARLDELHDDPVARTAIQRIYGMTLTGLIDDQAFYIFQGKGGDGKSMTNTVIADLHGDYFRSASPKTFLQSRHEKSGSEHQSDIVRLRGDIRLVVADEPKKGSTWDGERIKQVTGSRVTARAPNATEEVTFVPRWQLIVECNPLPNAPSDDRGFRRRFKLLPWLKTYGVTPGLSDEAPRIVEARLKAEKPGILNWMIEGALEWLDSGHVPEPEIAALAQSNYWASGSAMAEWIDARCDLSDPYASTSAGALYADFREFCLARGDKDDAIMKQTSFGKALNDRQLYAKKNASGLKDRVGIKLRPADGSAGAGAAAQADDPGPMPDGWRDDDPGFDDPFADGGADGPHAP